MRVLVDSVRYWVGPRCSKRRRKSYWWVIKIFTGERQGGSNAMEIFHWYEAQVFTLLCSMPCCFVDCRVVHRECWRSLRSFSWLMSYFLFMSILQMEGTQQCFEVVATCKLFSRKWCTAPLTSQFTNLDILEPLHRIVNYFNAVAWLHGSDGLALMRSPTLCQHPLNMILRMPQVS